MIPLLRSSGARVCRNSVACLIESNKKHLSSQLTTISRCGKKNNILKIAMSSPPVNSLGFQLIASLKDSIATASSDSTCEGIILASNCRVFSAGLNMNELYGATPDFLNSFWTNFQGIDY